MRQVRNEKRRNRLQIKRNKGLRTRWRGIRAERGCQDVKYNQNNNRVSHPPHRDCPRKSKPWSLQRAWLTPRSMTMNRTKTMKISSNCTRRAKTCRHRSKNSAIPPQWPPLRDNQLSRGWVRRPSLGKRTHRLCSLQKLPPREYQKCQRFRPKNSHQRYGRASTIWDQMNLWLTRR